MLLENGIPSMDFGREHLETAAGWLPEASRLAAFQRWKAWNHENGLRLKHSRRFVNEKQPYAPHERK